MREVAISGKVCIFLSQAVSSKFHVQFKLPLTSGSTGHEYRVFILKFSIYIFMEFYPVCKFLYFGRRKKLGKLLKLFSKWGEKEWFFKVIGCQLSKLISSRKFTKSSSYPTLLYLQWQPVKITVIWWAMEICSVAKVQKYL